MAGVQKCHCGKKIILTAHGWDCPDWEKHDSEESAQREQVNELFRLDTMRMQDKQAAEDY